MVTVKTYAHLTPYLTERLVEQGVAVAAQGPEKRGVAHTIDAPSMVNLTLPEGSVVHESEFLPDSLGEFGPLAPRLLATLPTGRRVVVVYGNNGFEDIDIW